MLILRRSNCISTASGIATLFRWLFSTQEWTFLILCTEHWPRESDDTRCCTNKIWPPEDEHNNARNMWRSVVNVLNKEDGKKGYYCIRIQGKQNIKILLVRLYSEVTQTSLLTADLRLFSLSWDAWEMSCARPKSKTSVWQSHLHRRGRLFQLPFSVVLPLPPLFPFFPPKQ